MINTDGYLRLSFLRPDDVRREQTLRTTDRPCTLHYIIYLSRKASGSKQERLEGWRQKFLSGLQSEGLEMEDVRLRNKIFVFKTFLLKEYQDQGKQCLHFIKIHAPWTVVSSMAMQLNLRAPIQVDVSNVGLLNFPFLRLNPIRVTTGLPGFSPPSASPT